MCVCAFAVVLVLFVLSGSHSPILLVHSHSLLASVATCCVYFFPFCFFCSFLLFLSYYLTHWNVCTAAVVERSKLLLAVFFPFRKYFTPITAQHMLRVMCWSANSREFPQFSIVLNNFFLIFWNSVDFFNSFSVAAAAAVRLNRLSEKCLNCQHLHCVYCQYEKCFVVCVRILSCLCMCAWVRKCGETSFDISVLNTNSPPVGIGWTKFIHSCFEPQTYSVLHYHITINGTADAYLIQ